MKNHLALIIFLLAFIGVSSFKGQAQKARIQIVTATIEQEASSIWRTINDIHFFEKQGYQIHLPQAPLIDSLVAKSKLGAFANDDYPAIYNLLEQGYFDPEDYQQATVKVQEQLPMLHQFIREIEAAKGNWDWDFRMFDHYQIVFTLYGTGGSYDPDEGMVTLLTNREGKFMKYQNPAYTIIHEITHMGMEYSLVQKHQLAHGLKERLVDSFVFLMFQSQLPGYEIQNMGDPALDTFLRGKKDIDSLNRFLSEYKGQ